MRIFGAICVVLLLATATMAQNGFPGMRRITLEEAKAAAAGTAAVRSVAQLEIDAARYHRQAAQADYFPKLGADFLNMHYNKFMGQSIEVLNRNIGVPLFGKDWTAVALTAVQPVTQLLQVRQAVTVARADERIAQAKATQLTAQNSANVERVYFGLLIAQRRHIVAQKKLELLESTAPSVSTVAMTSTNALEHEAVFLEANKELVSADSEVSELTHTLNALIGYSPDTKLILAVPEPVTETISLIQATQQAVNNSPDVVEAEQTLVKAKAASRLAKLDYVPGVAFMGGYINQPQAVIPLLPGDFSFIGFTAT